MPAQICSSCLKGRPSLSDLSNYIPVPLLAFGFVVLVTTFAGMGWLASRRWPTVQVSNAPVAPPEPWLRIPYLDALFALPYRLPGMYRPIGIWLGAGLTVVAAACILWETPGFGLAAAIASNYYLEMAMERARMAGPSVPGLISSIGLLFVAVSLAMIHFVLLARAFFG